MIPVPSERIVLCAGGDENSDPVSDSVVSVDVRPDVIVRYHVEVGFVGEVGRRARDLDAHGGVGRAGGA